MIALLGALAAGCSRSGPGPGEARLTVDGRVELARRGEAWQPVKGSPLLHRGDKVKVIEGSAVLEAASGVGYELREDSELEFADTAVLERGVALATAGSTPARIDAGGTVAAVTSGAARITRDLAVAVSTYRGVATVTSAGRSLQVPALREVGIAATGLVPTAAEPLDYNPGDVWDRRYLGAAMALDDELSARSRGFSSQLRPGESVPSVLLRALPALASVSLVAEAQNVDVPAGEALVGAAITLSTKGQPSVDQWRAVFGFRAAGAAWGLVALDQQADEDELLDLLDAAETRAPLTIAAAGGAPVAPSSPGTPTRPGSTTGTPTRPNGSPTTSTPPTSSPPTTTVGPPTTPPVTVPTPPLPEPPPSPPDPSGTPEQQDPLTQVVEAIVGGFLG